MAESKQTEIIKAALDNIKSVIDANTVIGEPIVTSSGTTIIPVSKISVGYVSGGLDYLNKNAAQAKDVSDAYKSFGGGGGTGVTLNPVCFISVDKDGNSELLNLNASSSGDDSISRIVSAFEKSPEIINKIKSTFSKKKKKKEEVEEEDREEPAEE